MNIFPVADRVVIVPDPTEEKVVSGIVLPGTHQTLTFTGEVIAAGPGRYTIDGTLLPNKIGVGYRVLYNQHDAVECELDGKKYIVMRADNVLAVLT